MLDQRPFQSFSSCIGGFFFLFLSIAFITYWPALQNGFVFDDHYQIINNPWITSFSHIHDIFTHHVWDFLYTTQDGNNPYYRPLMHIIFTIEYFFFSLDPMPWHAVNIIWHSINASLVFLFTLLFFTKILPSPTKEKGVVIPAFLGTLIFLFHPLNAEVVNWIATVPELAFFSCILLSSIFYFLPYSFHRRLAAGFFFFLALLFKETAFLLIVFFLFFEYFLSPNTLSPKKIAVRFLQHNWAFLFGALIVFSLRMTTENSTAPTFVVPSLFVLLLNALIDGPAILVHYFQRLFLLTDLTFLYPFEILSPKHLPWSALFISITLFFALFRKTLLNNIHWKNFFFTLLFGFSWVIIFLGPSFVSIVLGISTLADRYFYVPFIGINILFSYSIYSLSIRTTLLSQKMLFFIFCILIFILSTTTQERSKAWFSSQTLFENSLKRFPDNLWARLFLNDYNAQRGIIPPPYDFEKINSRPKNFSVLDSKRLECNLLTIQFQALLFGGDAFRALELINKSVIECKKENVLFESSMKRSQGMAYFFLGEMTLAEQYLKQSYTLIPAMETARSLAQYYCFTKNQGQATFYSKEALRLGDHKERVATLKKNCSTANPQTLYRELESFHFLP